MATVATIGTGCTLGIDPAGGSSYTTVAEVQTISLNQTCSEVDVTALDSAGVSQWLAGTRAATVTVTGNFLPDKHDITAGPNLYTKFQARATIGWKITWNDPTTASSASGTGFITDLSPNVGGHDAGNDFTMTIRVDGSDVTLAGMATA